MHASTRRFTRPQIPIIKNIGFNTDSKKILKTIKSKTGRPPESYLPYQKEQIIFPPFFYPAQVRLPRGPNGKGGDQRVLSKEPSKR